MAQSLEELYVIPALAAGATYVLTHTLQDGDGTKLVPNWVQPTSHGSPVVPGNPSSPTPPTDTTVTFQNNSAQPSNPVTFRVGYEHSILRSSKQGLAGLLFFYAGPDGVGGASGGSYIEISGMTLIAGSYEPVDEIVYVYVQPDYGASGAWLGPGAPTYGDDGNPGTKDLPFRTLPGVVQRFGRRGIQGVHIIVKIGGYSVRPAGGWPVAPIDPTDPWDGDATQDRNCFTRELEFTGSDAFRAGYSFHGPRRMFPLTPALTFVNAVQVGLRVQLNFVENVFAAGMQGCFLRLYQPDARDVFYPHVISEVVAPNSIMVEPPFDAADWNFWAAAPNTCRAFSPTVQMGGGPDYEAGGVHVHGDGAGRLGDARTGGAPVTRNPIPHLYSLMIIRGSYNIQGQWLACAVWFDDGSEFLPGGQPILKGCSGGPNGYIRWAADGRVLNADSEYLPNRENTGYAEVSALPAPGPPDINPIVQVGGPGELVIAGDCNLLITDALGAHPGTMRILHGLSMICSTNRIPLRITGGAKLYQSDDINRLAFLVLRTAGAVPAIWATATGTSVFINQSAVYLELGNGGGGLLRVGKGAAIGIGAGVGEWLEVAGFNGYFTRRHELSGTGFPTDDASEIVSTAWMPADYAGET